MPLHCKAEDIPNRQVVRSGEQGVGSMIVKRAYGSECSLMHAVRAPGYHTTPHAHAAEQTQSCAPRRDLVLRGK